MNQRTDLRNFQGKRQLAWKGLLIVIVLLLGWLGWLVTSRSPETQSTADQLRQARVALHSQDWKRVLEVADSISADQAEYSAACLLAGEAATRLERYEQAVQYYESVGFQKPAEYITAQLAAAEIQRLYGSLEKAERNYRSVLEVEEEHPLALDRLILILKLTGRHREANQSLNQLLSTGNFRIEHLQWLCDPFRSLDANEFLQSADQRAAGQAFVQLGLADHAQSRGEFERARKYLAQARESKPEHPEIEAAWGEVLLALNDVASLADWWNNSTDVLRASPVCCYVIGRLFEQQGEVDKSISCFLQTIEGFPHHRSAAYHLGQLLKSAEEADTGQSLLDHSQRLTQLSLLAGSVTNAAPAQEACRQLCEILETMQREQEAIAWAEVARQQDERLVWPADLQGRLERRVRSNAADQSVVLRAVVKLSETYSAAESLRVTDGSLATTFSSSDDPQMMLVPEAEALGLRFQYYESPDPTTPGRRMFEFTGGGVAALDYDQDGWVDVHFTQGCDLPGKPQQKIWLDQLYRNLGTGQFQEVAELSLLIEDRFSQGVAAGDYNNDGFTDLYIANLGQNRLFENLGDGTFQEVELETIGADEQWTTSCLIADLNGDSIPDLYDVNYVGGPDFIELICETPAGPRVCTPFAFPAAPDRILQGKQEGGFRDVSQQAGVALPNGKGLGIVASRFDEDAALELFVANDTEANFMFDLPDWPVQNLNYQEQALWKGLAFSESGAPQACMGIAAADFNSDLRNDLFVTNYFNESNALYLSRSAEGFDESSRRSGIRQLSLTLLGFGSQALDVDGDGDLDIALVNGDLDDFSHDGRAFQMPAQLLLNDGNGNFSEYRSTSTADYFHAESQRRGRGMARLDWNRDGLEDLAVSHLDEPSVLITNRSEVVRKSLKLTLVGTASARSAIGTEVELREQGGDWIARKWLSAGDGYLASNERCLVFTLPENHRPIEMSVRWPSGGTDGLPELPLDSSSAQHFLCVEGAKELFEQRHTEISTAAVKQTR